VKSIRFFTIILLCTVGCSVIPKEKSISICFTGDVMLDRGVRHNIDYYGVDYIFSEVSSLFKAVDFTVINLECPVTNISNPADKQYVFIADPEWMPQLKEQGITHLNLANNHTLDQGINGFKSTVKSIREAELIPFGFSNGSKKIIKPVIIEKDLISIAVFSSIQYDMSRLLPAKYEVAPNQHSIETICESIESYKAVNSSHHVVVYLHWGLEYMREPESGQIEDAHRLIDSGAEAVIGHHPHCLQTEEIYKGKPIFYSLGNLVFDQDYPESQQGAIVELVFSKNSVESVIVHRVCQENRIPVVKDKYKFQSDKKTARN
jgi:poly-gamma-glutamate capsule biosynthesis protein CapA/YwtB (metallophosphatase superfamily)